MNYRRQCKDILSTTEVCREMGVQISVSQIKALKIEPDSEYHTGTFWLKSDLPKICLALAQQLINKSDQLEGKTNATPSSKDR